jgi:hypothetical protein
MKLYVRLIILLTIVLLTPSLKVFSQQFSILTCKSGRSFANSFGHVAIRYSDPYRSVDHVYDYRVYDITESDLISKLVLGQLIFSLRKEPTAYFTDYYANKNIQVKEQFLNLSDNQAKNLYSYLENSLNNKSNFYPYNFLFQNCSTKILDILESQCGNVNMHFYKESSGHTFRDLIHEKSKNLNPWQSYTIDLMLGPLTDKIIEGRSYCFLPKYLSKSLKLSFNNEINQPLVKSEHVLIWQDFEVYNRSFFTQPLCVALLLLVLSITHLIFRKKLTQLLLGLTFIIIGMLGSIITCGAILFALDITYLNFNIVWMNPLALLYGLFLIIKKDSKLLRYLFISGIIIAFLSYILKYQTFEITTLVFMASCLIGSLNVSIQTLLDRLIERKTFILENEGS